MVSQLRPAPESDVPPQHLEAEEHVLGAILLSANAIDAVVDILEPDGAMKFFRPSHGTIYQAAREMHGAGRPVDAITLTDELDARGKLADVGGRVRLYELAALVPASANASHYARIVVEMWMLRAVISAGVEIARMGRERTDEADVVLAKAEELTSSIRARLERRREETFTMYEAAEYLDAKFRDPPDEGFGIPTPWSWLPSLHGGRLYVLGGYQADGKLLALDTLLPTPDGWTTVGDLMVGDALLGDDGKPCSVAFITETKYDRKAYELEFSDGAKIVACADHLWLTETNQARASRSRAARRVYNDASPYSRRQERLQPEVRMTQEIVDTLHVGGKANHSIRNTAPLDLPEREVPVDPYLLGVWLGDGSTRTAMITTADPEILAAFEAGGHEITHRGQYDYGVVRGGFSGQLRTAGVLGNKHIPDAYLRASCAQRLALVQGLMDTDGGVSRRGQCEFTSVIPGLAESMCELLVSLGVKVTVRKGRSFLYGVEHKPRYRLTFTTALPVFRLARKLMRLRQKVGDSCGYRTIVAVREVESVPMRCISVENESHLFLAGKSMIPTHNTVQAAHFFRSAVNAGVSTDLVSLEMAKEDLAERVAANMGIPAKQVQSGRLQPEHRDLAARVIGDMAGMGNTGRIRDMPSADIASIRRVVQTAGSKYLIVDHLHQFHVRAEYERQDLEEIIRGLWRLAREFDIPVLLLAQLSRSGDKKQPYPRPTMASLRGSAMIEALAWAVYFVWRERDERNIATEKAEFVVAKNRSGPTGIRNLTFWDRETRFTEVVREG